MKFKWSRKKNEKKKFTTSSTFLFRIPREFYSLSLSLLEILFLNKRKRKKIGIEREGYNVSFLHPLSLSSFSFSHSYQIDSFNSIKTTKILEISILAIINCDNAFVNNVCRLKSNALWRTGGRGGRAWGLGGGKPMEWSWKDCSDLQTRKFYSLENRRRAWRFLNMKVNKLWQGNERRRDGKIQTKFHFSLFLFARRLH